MTLEPDPAAKVRRYTVLRWRILALVLCTLGAALSADLIRLHVKVHTDPNYRSYCAINEWANCETVAESPQAVAFGLPVAAWGFLFYLGAGALTAWGIRRPLSPSSWPFGLLFWAGLVSSGISVYLFVLSHVVIESVCIVCTGTYVVNFLLTAVSWIELRRFKLNPFRALTTDLAAVRSRPASVGALVGAFVAAVAVLWLTVPAYWAIETSGNYVGFTTGETEEGYPWIGAEKPTVVIAEFSDYQCPHCQRGHDQIRQLIADHRETVRLVHRHYPLDQACNRQLTRPFHPLACAYAKIAFCAEEQGRFWEANDFLFTNGRRKQAVTTSEVAEAIAIDAGELQSCVAGKAATAAIEADLAAGRSFGIRGTPTFVIDGTAYPGSIPAEVLARVLGGEGSQK